MIKRDQELFEKIEAYLEQRMDPQELSAFRQALEENPALQEEVTKHQELEEALTDDDAEAFKKKLKKIRNSLDMEQRPTLKISYYWYAAASLVVLLGIVMFFQPWGSSTQELYDLYYKPYPGPQIIRGENDTIPLAQILGKYQKGQYEKAIPQLKQAIAHAPDNHELYLYLGNCNLQIGEVSHALETLLLIPLGSQYWPDAQWFMAMGYLKMGDQEKAMANLNMALQDGGIHKNNAKQLLEEL